ncbi:MAG: prepilin peptidase [Planctomycetota bacterium]|nr:MAG: prepilin peptidase [Planctomycetota bacterium]
MPVRNQTLTHKEIISLYNHYFAIFVLCVGACIGSFINVVIYRWSRGMSVRKPVWSFCPACKKSIAWYDNIPVISYLLLQGRCRKCRVPISLHYPFVELATAFIILLAYDAMFVARQRIGIGAWLLPGDWVMMVTHWVLFGGLIVLAVMDLEVYLVDIRVTWIISAVALVGHALWVPSCQGWIRPGPYQAAISLAALIGLVVGSWLFLRRRAGPVPDSDNQIPPVDSEELTGRESPQVPVEQEIRAPSRWGWILVIIPLALLVGYLTAILIAGAQEPLTYFWPVTGYSADALYQQADRIDDGLVRVGVGLAIVFIALTLAAGNPHAQADSDIVETIAAEAPDSRRNALWELKLLTPAIFLSLVVAALLITQPGIKDEVQHWLSWEPIGRFQPLWGLATAVSGWIIGGAIGWLARILFTLLFRKEAFGMGDVHILAAAGAVAGWPVAFLGFFLAAPLTLAAMLVIQMRRQSRAVPYGPWLGLGFLLAGLLQDRILLFLGVRSLL